MKKKRWSSYEDAKLFNLHNHLGDSLKRTIAAFIADRKDECVRRIDELHNPPVDLLPGPVLIRNAEGTIDGVVHGPAGPPASKTLKKKGTPKMKLDLSNSIPKPVLGGHSIADSGTRKTPKKWLKLPSSGDKSSPASDLNSKTDERAPTDLPTVRPRISFKFSAPVNAKNNVTGKSENGDGGLKDDKEANEGSSHVQKLLEAEKSLAMER